MMLSCNPPTVKKPVEMFAINFKFNAAKIGKKNLNIKAKKKYVGEWVKKPELIPVHEVPENIMCFSMKTWLKTIKPKLKEGSQYYRDR